ncbi:MAG: 2-dehydropantoate 2-reductase [Paracoccaceae bacterium]|nr:2-dehydropantoate 2-reductase [Paracoccaceae bacterium]
MKIAVVGAGAMGSVYAAKFATSGHQVLAVDPWQDHVEAINSAGLKIQGPDGEATVLGIKATTDVKDCGHCDLFVIATKASAVGAAARAIKPYVDLNTVVLTIQNGLGAGDRIATHLATANVLLGVADGFGASMKGPGHVHHNAMKLIRLGEMSGGRSDRLEELEGIWQGAGFNARAFEDIHQLIWEKLLCNVTLSAPCSVFECNVGELRSSDEHWLIALGCMQEAYKCGLAQGIAFSFDDPQSYVTAFADMMPAANPSMRLDHFSKRESEIDFINGAIPALGQRHNIATPYNQTLSAIVRNIENQFERHKT